MSGDEILMIVLSLRSSCFWSQILLAPCGFVRPCLHELGRKEQDLPDWPSPHPDYGLSLFLRGLYEGQMNFWRLWPTDLPMSPILGRRQARKECKTPIKAIAHNLGPLERSYPPSTLDPGDIFGDKRCAVKNGQELSPGIGLVFVLLLKCS